MLYTWQGSKPELEPKVLLGHIDVVPVIPRTEADWEHQPFDGIIADGFIWARYAKTALHSQIGCGQIAFFPSI